MLDIDKASKEKYNFKVGDKVKFISNESGAYKASGTKYKIGDVGTINKIDELDVCWIESEWQNNVILYRDIVPFVEAKMVDNPTKCSCSMVQLMREGCNCGGI